MSKTGGGCLAVLVIGGVAFPGVGLFLASVGGMAWLGGSIGQHSGIVTAYVVIGFIASYVIPAVCLVGFLAFLFVTSETLELQSLAMGLVAVLYAVIYLVVASVVFAIPSSFIADAACRAGNPRSEWVMRVIPGIWAGETFLAKPDQKLACVGGHLKLGGS